MSIGKQEQAKDGFVTVACKVPEHIARLLNIIAKARDVKVYQLLQMCIEFLIETAKVQTEPSPDMKVLLSMFRMDADWNRCLNYCHTTAQLDIAQAIFITQQRDEQGPRKGFGVVMFDKPFMGDTRQTLSKDQILERVCEVVMGTDDYLQLRKIGIDLESESIRETLCRMIDAQVLLNLQQQDHDQLPAMGNYHDFGKAIEYGNRTRRRRHVTPDTAQLHIRFDDSDREQADREALDGEYRQTEPPPTDIVGALGCKPFDVEP